MSEYSNNDHAVGILESPGTHLEREKPFDVELFDRTVNAARELKLNQRYFPEDQEMLFAGLNLLYDGEAVLAENRGHRHVVELVRRRNRVGHRGLLPIALTVSPR